MGSLHITPDEQHVLWKWWQGSSWPEPKLPPLPGSGFTNPKKYSEQHTTKLQPYHFLLAQTGLWIPTTSPIARFFSYSMGSLNPKSHVTASSLSGFFMQQSDSRKWVKEKCQSSSSRQLQSQVRKQADTHALASSSLFPSQSESCNQWVLEILELRRLLQRK